MSPPSILRSAPVVNPEPSRFLAAEAARRCLPLSEKDEEIRLSVGRAEAAVYRQDHPVDKTGILAGRWGNASRAEINGVQVGGHYLTPAFGGDLREGTEGGKTRVVDQHVQLPAA